MANCQMMNSEYPTVSPPSSQPWEGLVTADTNTIQYNYKYNPKYINKYKQKHKHKYKKLIQTQIPDGVSSQPWEGLVTAASLWGGVAACTNSSFSF